MSIYCPGESFWYVQFDEEGHELQEYVIRCIRRRRRPSRYFRKNENSDEPKIVTFVQKNDTTWVIVERKKGKDNTYKRGWANNIELYTYRYELDKCGTNGPGYGIYHTKRQAYKYAIRECEKEIKTSIKEGESEEYITRLKKTLSGMKGSLTRLIR
jgi:hypothetical protein